MKNSYSSVIVCALFLVFAGSCSDAPEQAELISDPVRDTEGRAYFDSEEELRHWSENSEAVNTTKEIGGFWYGVTILSPDYLALQELRSREYTAEELAEAKSHYEELYYFKFGIRRPDFQKELLHYNIDSQQEYSSRINYCAFAIQQDLKLAAGTDTIPCALVQFERTFEAGPGLTFTLAFPRKSIHSEEIDFIYYDNLFQNGIMKFRFTKAALLALPYLKMG